MMAIARLSDCQRWHAEYLSVVDRLEIQLALKQLTPQDPRVDQILDRMLELRERLGYVPQH